MVIQRAPTVGLPKANFVFFQVVFYRIRGGQVRLVGSGDTYVYGVSQSPYTWEGYDEMAADVQLWLDHPAENFGWMLISRSEGEIFSARRFAAREDSFRAPSLVIDFTPVPEPGVLAVGGMALFLIGVKRWCGKRQ